MSVGTILTGKEFNEIYCDVTFYKLTNATEIHYEFKYNDGLNIDSVQFNPSNECSPGGLYFTEESKLSMWFNVANTYIRKVIIPNDAKVYIEENKFKADKIFLESKIKLKDFYKWNDSLFCIRQVKQNGYALQFVKEQTPEICLATVKQNVSALQFVKEQTPEICLAAVRQNKYALQFVKEQTPEICMEAVKQDGIALQFVKEQTPEICLAAVKKCV